MNINLLTTKVHQIITAAYNFIMASAIVAIHWSAMTVVKVLDFSWKMRQLISHKKTTQQSLASDETDADKTASLKPIDDHRA